MILLNPHFPNRYYPDERSPQIMRQTSSSSSARANGVSRKMITTAPGTATSWSFKNKSPVCHPAHARPHMASTATAAGYLAQLRVQRNPGFLRPGLLVHLAGEHPGLGTGMDESK